MTAIETIPSKELAHRQLRYFDFVMAAFVAILLLSNIVGASKLSSITVGDYSFTYGAGILFFPIGYVIGDVLTEVYGFARARRVIWVGFAALIFAAFMSYFVVALPPSDAWQCAAGNDAMFADATKANGAAAVCQSTYISAFGNTWRIVIASLAGFWAGEFVNSIVMARMKIWTKGKALWTRTIGSTIVGQGVDSLIFYPIAFYGVWNNEVLLTVMVTNWALKIAWEIALTPITYAVVGMLKRREGVDVYDTDTDFTPFKTTV